MFLSEIQIPQTLTIEFRVAATRSAAAASKAFPNNLTFGRQQAYQSAKFAVGHAKKTIHLPEILTSSADLHKF
jgi:hypothetical protein